MGIGNLNNNFGSLTAGGVNKTTNLKNTAKAETTVKNDVSFNADSLKSATLSDKEGVKFDSDNMTDKTDLLYAPKGKGKGKKRIGTHTTMSIVMILKKGQVIVTFQD